MYNKEETIRQTEVRRPVTFESETGYRLFGDALEKQKEKARQVGSQSFVVPFLACINKTSILSDAAVYNDETAACDRNGNGIISDMEAVAYHKLATGTSSVLDDERQIKNLLVQRGELQVSPSQACLAVHFATPYLWPPELTFPNMGLPYQKLEQFAHGFRIWFKEGETGTTVSWQARGIPVDSPTPPDARLLQPAVYAPANKP